MHHRDTEDTEGFTYSLCTLCLGGLPLSTTETRRTLRDGYHIKSALPEVITRERMITPVMTDPAWIQFSGQIDPWRIVWCAAARLPHPPHAPVGASHSAYRCRYVTLVKGMDACRLVACSAHAVISLTIEDTASLPGSPVAHRLACGSHATASTARTGRAQVAARTRAGT